MREHLFSPFLLMWEGRFSAATRTQMYPLAVWTVAGEAQVSRSRLMTAVIAIQNAVY